MTKKQPAKEDNSSLKKKRGPGKPRFEPTEKNREQVETMAGYGVPLHQVASLIGIDEKTLYKYFRKEIDEGKAKANAQIGLSLFQQATTGENTSAAIWWTKSQMGWKDHSRPDPVVNDSEDGATKIADAMKHLADRLPN